MKVRGLFMKKYYAFTIILSVLLSCTTGCSDVKRPKQNLIQSKRRFAEFVESKEQKDPNTIDLSEGPKLRYDAHLGPQNLNFDIKIVDPYKKEW